MKFLRRVSIEKPKLTVIISLLLTAIIASGIKSLVIEDDFFKMFPTDMESRLLWEDMTDEFGDSEFVLVVTDKVSFGDRK